MSVDLNWNGISLDFTELDLTSPRYSVPGRRFVPPVGITIIFVRSAKPSLYFSRPVLPSSKGDISPALKAENDGADLAITYAPQ